MGTDNHDLPTYALILCIQRMRGTVLICLAHHMFSSYMPTNRLVIFIALCRERNPISIHVERNLDSAWIYRTSDVIRCIVTVQRKSELQVNTGISKCDTTVIFAKYLYFHIVVCLYSLC
jgi:hypothetical protein